MSWHREGKKMGELRGGESQRIKTMLKVTLEDSVSKRLSGKHRDPSLVLRTP